MEIEPGTLGIWYLLHWRIQGRVARDMRPLGVKFFHFHTVFGKYLKSNSTFGSWRTPWEKSWIRHCLVLYPHAS